MLLLTSCQQKKVEEVEELVLELTSDPVTLEYGQDVDMKKYILNSNYDEIEITKVDTTITGTQKITYKATKSRGKDKDMFFGKQEETKTLIVTIVDTKAPLIETDKEVIEIEQGSDFNLLDYIKAFDSVDGELTPISNQTIDTSKLGQQEISVSATDTNGLFTAKNIIVVVSKPKETAVVETTPPNQKKPDNSKDDGGNTQPETPPVEQPTPPQNQTPVETRQPVITTRQETLQEVLSFQTVTVQDGSLPKGQTAIRQNGQNGAVSSTYTITLTDGVETSRVLSSQVVTQEPINQITAVGTQTFTPQTKQFLFIEGYTFDTALSSCREYIQSAMQQGYVGMAQCLTLTDSSDVYIGYQAVFQ